MYLDPHSIQIVVLTPPPAVICLVANLLQHSWHLHIFFFALFWFDCMRCTTLNPLNNGADYIGSIQMLDYHEMLKEVWYVCSA